MTQCVAPMDRKEASYAPATTKRLTLAEQEEAGRKLYHAALENRRKQQEGREQALIAECKFKPNKKLAPEAEEALVKHLYDMQLQQREVARERRLAELERGSSVPTKQLSGAALVDSVDRMYYQAKSRQEEKAVTLARKYQPPLKSKRLDAEAVKSVSERLYDSEKGKFEKRREELWQKHIAPMQPMFPKLSADQVVAMASRLSTTNRS
eukprot:GGOE01001768.1.p1 GENE.GGOE01001768.1~~GGOE01001768.1.p1  ORF type:complete len:209 (-),score=67.02 GGOE01001768.1:90-716(-)